MEKTMSGERAPSYEHQRRASDVKEMRYGEAADLYGDAETVEKYGYVSRG